MKQSLFLTTLVVLLAGGTISATTVQAEMGARPTEKAERMMVRTENKEQRQAQISKTRKANANREIDRRITALTGLINRLNNLKRISADQKASLVSQLQTAINDLTALKAKIAADTDEATLKADKQSIIDSYRIFALLLPKVEIIAHADAILQSVTEANATTAKAQARWQASGKDLSSLQASLTDRQAKLADATTQAQNAINSVTTLTPADYPANKSSLETARTLLKTSRRDMQTAHQDLVKAEQAFKALK